MYFEAIAIAAVEEGPVAAVARGSIHTYFLHDVIDPGRRAVAEVRALGVPVA